MLLKSDSYLCCRLTDCSYSVASLLFKLNISQLLFIPPYLLEVHKSFNRIFYKSNSFLQTSSEVLYTHFFYKQLLYKQGSTWQGKKLSNFSTGLKTAKQCEKCVNGALGRSPTNFGKSYFLD